MIGIEEAAETAWSVEHDPGFLGHTFFPAGYIPAAVFDRSGFVVMETPFGENYRLFHFAVKFIHHLAEQIRIGVGVITQYILAGGEKPAGAVSIKIGVNHPVAVRVETPDILPCGFKIFIHHLLVVVAAGMMVFIAGIPKKHIRGGAEHQRHFFMSIGIKFIIRITKITQCCQRIIARRRGVNRHDHHSRFLRILQVLFLNSFQT